MSSSSGWSSSVALVTDRQELNENLIACRARAKRVAPTTYVLVDIGAGDGEALAEFLTAGWDVWAFEPDPSHRVRLFDRLAHFEHLPRRVDARDLHDIDLDGFLLDNEIDHVDHLRLPSPTGGPAMLSSLLERSNVRPASVLLDTDWRATASVPNIREAARNLVELDYQVLVSEWFPTSAACSSPAWRRLFEYSGDEFEAVGPAKLLCFDEALGAEKLDELTEGAMKTRSVGAMPSNGTNTTGSVDPQHLRDAVDASRFDALVELLHDAVMTLARHERSIRDLEEARRIDRADADVRAPK